MIVVVISTNQWVAADPCVRVLHPVCAPVQKRIRFSCVSLTVLLVFVMCCCLFSGKANLAEHGKFTADEDGAA
eukprot:11234-Eustigmatos_ZCMA.PRE.1